MRKKDILQSIKSNVETDEEKSKMRTLTQISEVGFEMYFLISECMVTI